MFRLALSFALALSAFAADWTKLKPEGYVSDFAHVVDTASRESIERLKRNPFVKYKDHIRGFVYDVADGKLHEV